MCVYICTVTAAIPNKLVLLCDLFKTIYVVIFVCKQKIDTIFASILILCLGIETFLGRFYFDFNSLSWNRNIFGPILFRF